MSAIAVFGGTALPTTLLAMRLPLFPRMRLNLFSGFSCDLVRDVLTGELDAAVVIEPPDSEQLTGVKIDESLLYVVFSRDDPLATYPSITLAQLASRRWILFQRSSHPPLYDSFKSVRKLQGRSPQQ